MTYTKSGAVISPADVHRIIGRQMLADGLDLVLDLRRSHGRRLVDARNGREWLDMFSCFATMPIGFNHPRTRDPEFIAKLLAAAAVNPTNSDVYTVEMAEFVDTWSRLAMPPEFRHLFLISGGTLAVENALKAAFDWKVKKNRARGQRREIGHQVIHFSQAFHGRSGYCLSLTNTADPRKYQFFPGFNWPRVVAPALRWPIDAAELTRVAVEEHNSLETIESVFRVRRDDVAAIIIEPIQGEGGDNHFRPEFLQALRRLADAHEVLLIFDEIQTGMGLTGRMWAYQHSSVVPDMLVFGKKSQICGLMAGPRLDEIPDNVFREPSRLNSTWGGNLTDMVRCQRYLEIMAEEHLIDNAGLVGQALRQKLQLLAAAYPRVLSNARGQGLMCAIDFADTQTRDAVRTLAFQKGMIILPCGECSLRFRPPLDVNIQEVQQAIDILDRSLAQYINS